MISNHPQELLESINNKIRFKMVNDLRRIASIIVLLCFTMIAMGSPISDSLTFLQSIIEPLLDSQSVEEAEPYIVDFLEISKDSKDPYYKAFGEFCMGHLENRQNRFKETCLHLMEAKDELQHLRRNDDVNRLEVRIDLALGASYLLKEMYSQAYECFMDGVKLNQETVNDPYLQFYLDNNLLVLMMNTNSDGDIIALGERLLSNVQTDQNRYYAYANIGVCHFTKEAYDTALCYFDSAYRFCHSPIEKATILNYRAQTLYALGQYEETILVCDSALRFLGTDDNEIRPKTLILKGVLLAELQKNDSALHYIDEGIDIAREAGFLATENMGLRNKCDLLFSLKRYEDYAYAMVQYVAVNDSVNRLNDINRLRQLEAQHDLEMVKLEMAQTQRMKEIDNQRFKLITSFVILVLVAVIAIVLLLLNRKNILLKNRKIQEDVIAKELDLKKREMTANALVQVERQGVLTEMIDKLKAIADDKSSLQTNVKEVIKTFEEYRNATTPEDFEYYFTQTHPDFYNNLRADFPNLTSNEMRLCAFLKLNLTTKDIAAICRISPESAMVARSRLRKKLHLVGSEEDLSQFLSKY